MKRRLLNLLTAMSLLLCVAVCGMFAWSYDTWRFGTARGRMVAVFATGRDAEPFILNTLRSKQSAANVAFEELAPYVSQSWRFAGFEYQSGAMAPPLMTFRYRVVALPMWPLLPLSLALPAARLWLARRDQRRGAMKCCLRCGYDLRATPGRCPECGAAGGLAGERAATDFVNPA
jgi:hypothetical protein